MEKNVFRIGQLKTAIAQFASVYVHTTRTIQILSIVLPAIWLGQSLENFFFG